MKDKTKYIDINKVTIPRSFFNQDLNVPKLLEWLDSQPEADVVEVVRCCECIHKQENPDINNTCFLTCNLSHGLQGVVDPTDFCSYGARNTN